MPGYLHPGVYIERRSRRTTPTVGISTSNFGICGFTRMGPENEATLVTSFEKFRETFGGFTHKGLVPLNVFAFFANSGRRAYVVRVVPADALASFVEIPAIDEPAGGWKITALSRGSWGDSIKVEFRESPEYFDVAKGRSTRYDFLVYVKDEETNEYLLREIFKQLVFDDPDSSFYFATCVNDPSKGSKFVFVEKPVKLLPEIPLGDVLENELEVVLDEVIVGSEFIDGISVEFEGEFSKKNIEPKSIKISYEYEINGETKIGIITSDGNGNLIGDTREDSNSIDYLTGKFIFRTKFPPVIDSEIKATYKTINIISSKKGEIVSYNLLGGADGDVSSLGRDDISNPDLLQKDYKGIYAFERTGEFLNIGLPDFVGDAINNPDQIDNNVGIAMDLVKRAKERKDWFCILSAPFGTNLDGVIDYRRLMLPGEINTCYAALYWPWILVTDPITENSIYIPSIGHVAGVYARTDGNKNVGKSPGGVEDGKLDFSIGLEYESNLDEIEKTDPIGINTLYQSIETGRVVWGVKTLATSGDFRFINAQRLFMYVEKYLYRTTQWVVFENNTPDLQVRLKSQVESFLLSLFEGGFFAGSKPEESFFVICDDTNNSDESMALGRITCDIGLAPNRPAEYVIFRLQQKTIAA